MNGASATGLVSTPFHVKLCRTPTIFSFTNVTDTEQHFGCISRTKIS